MPASILTAQLFDQRRYDLERVGRYKLNQRLRLDESSHARSAPSRKYDLVKLVEHMIRINNGLDNKMTLTTWAIAE